MSNQTFTPTDAVDMNNERDWAPRIGMMDWDSTQIVFTKRTLLEFLKYTGTTVDTNFSNISKLPRYAKFGKFSSDAPADTEAITQQLEKTELTSKEEDSAYRPSRRVRTSPGGPSSGLFEEEFADDALSKAPPQSKAPAPEPAVVASAATEISDEPTKPTSGVRPSRRVRENPGGKDSLSGGIWGEPENVEFKPTRRVRQGPGGQDSIGNIFG